MASTEPTPAPTYLIALGSTLPVTSTFALPLSAYYLFLQGRVVNHRLATRESISYSSQSSSNPKLDDKDSTAEPDRLLGAVRCQTNFAENVPLALILAGLVELNGGSKKVLAGVLTALCALRILHAELGVMYGRANFTGPGRPIGFFGTAGVIGGLAGWAAWLSRGFWDL